MSFLPLKLGCLMLPAMLLRCGPFPDLRGIAAGDLEPPVFLSAESTGPYSALFRFSEPVTPVTGSMALEPTIQPSAVSCTDNDVLLTFGKVLTPGFPYYVESTVADRAGNRLRFITHFYGFNPRVPHIVINEFITQGSGSHPDVVELLALKDGNLSGVCVVEGTKGAWTDRCVLPSTEVTAGDFILVHFKPDGTAVEIDEVAEPGASGGKDASPTAWDFWVIGGNGLSGNNGVIAVYDKPEGRLLDAVLYSNRTFSSDENYRGFGSKDLMLCADELAAEGGWMFEGEQITPEDGVNPEVSTATRSICRSSSSGDSNSRVDWHITPTGGASFGAVNTDEVYPEPE